MEIEEIEAILETIWDLHDKISDAIHAISRSHLLKSRKTLTLNKPTFVEKNNKMFGSNGDVSGGEKIGFVFVKDFRNADDEEEDVVDDDAVALAEARSLNSIRNALENFEDQLEFFHTVQSQQRAERDAALARLEQSRIILALRLADHQGKKYQVIEEALQFVGNVHNSSRFVSPENLFETPGHSGETLENQKTKKSSVLMRMFMSSMELAKHCLKMEKFGGAIGNAALFAVSVLAFLQLHQAAFKTTPPPLQGQCFYADKNKRIDAMSGSSSHMTHFDVYSARG